MTINRRKEANIQEKICRSLKRQKVGHMRGAPRREADDWCLRGAGWRQWAERRGSWRARAPHHIRSHGKRWLVSLLKKNIHETLHLQTDTARLISFRMGNPTNRQQGSLFTLFSGTFFIQHSWFTRQENRISKMIWKINTSRWQASKTTRMRIILNLFM